MGKRAATVEPSSYVEVFLDPNQEISNSMATLEELLLLRAGTGAPIVTGRPVNGSSLLGLDRVKPDPLI